MDTKRDVGGPAFPFQYLDADRDYPGQPETHTGMSLRDWFAGQALAGTFQDNNRNKDEVIARGCYAMADAMLREREK